MIKSPPDISGDTCSVPGLGRSSGEGNDNSLQCSCLEIPWIEESGGLQTMESQRVGHDLTTKQKQQKAVSVRWGITIEG